MILAQYWILSERLRSNTFHFLGNNQVGGVDESTCFFVPSVLFGLIVVRSTPVGQLWSPYKYIYKL